jgi:hypothetical protein
MMIESKAEITEMVERLYAACGTLDRGETLTHEEIRGATGLEPYEGSWQHVVGRTRRKLERERGIATWPEKGVGYRLLTKDEQAADLPRWRLKRAIRQANRGRKSVAALPDAGLSAHQRRVKAAQLDAMAAAGRELRAQARVQSILARRSPVAPKANRKTA